MRKVLRASALALALSVPAFAGVIHNPATEPPPPPPQQTAPGELYNPPPALINALLTLLSIALP